jgi:hypothetical protein
MTKSLREFTLNDILEFLERTRRHECPFTSAPTRPSITMTSSGGILGFAARRAKTDRRKAEAFERAEKERVRRQRVEPAASMSFDMAADRCWMEVGQHSKETGLEVNIAGLVERIGANTPPAEIDDDLLAHLIARRRGEPRRANQKFGLVSPATANRTVTQLLRRILTRCTQKVA